MIQRQVIMKNIRKPILSILLSLAFGFSSLFGANVVFDIGGVFADRSSKAICRHAGFKRLIYLLFQGKNPGRLLFNVLDEIPFEGEITDEDRLSCDHRGRPLPDGLLAWLKGNASGEGIVDAVQQYLDEESNDYGITEKIVIQKMAEAIFDPYFFAATTKIYSKMLVFAEECIKQGHKVFILSNLDRASFEELQEMIPGFFEQFEGIVLSADVGLLKPNPKIFTYLLDTYKLKPEETVFIDDQQENLDAAQALGIYPILCSKTGWLKKRPNVKKVAATFDRWHSEMTPETAAPMA